ncbi:hypothetical protein S245_035044, partial [Arachis hypogaea]
YCGNVWDERSGCKTNIVLPQAIQLVCINWRVRDQRIIVMREGHVKQFKVTKSHKRETHSAQHEKGLLLERCKFGSLRFAMENKSWDLCF